ncbi:MAG: flagellin [Vicinamibacterales bacterium]
MRVTFNQVRDGLVAINTAAEQFAEAQWQVSTGLRVRVPSDDPVAAQRAVLDQAEIDHLDTYKSVNESAGSRLSAMDSALTNIIDRISGALVALQGSMGSTATQVVRDQAALSFEGIRDAIAADINLTFGGTRLFAGTNSNVSAYAKVAGAWTYQGTNSAMTVDVAENRSVTIAMDGQAIMQGSDATDLLTTLDNLATAARTNDTAALQAGLVLLNNGFTRATRAQSMIGNDETTVDDTNERLSTLKLAAAARLSSDRDANMAEAITRMNKAQTTYQSALGAVAAASKVSLLDYLK